MGYLEAKEIVKEHHLRNKTRSELVKIVKDKHFHKVEHNHPGYHSKTTIIEILSAELQN